MRSNETATFADATGASTAIPAASTATIVASRAARTFIERIYLSSSNG